MTADRIVLGIKYLGHDTAASLMIDGDLIAACAQERYTLDKHSRAFPSEAINDCLRIGNVSLKEVDQIAFVGDLRYLVREHYLRPAFQDDARLDYLVDDFERIKIALGMESEIRERTGYDGEIEFYRHHLCHAASTYFPSGYKDALIYSVDGIGERESTLLASGVGGKITTHFDGNVYPNSLGLIYSALTYYLGWRHHCDEGIVMGLASYGDPYARIPGQKSTYYDVFEEIITEDGDYGFRIDMTWADYFETRDKWISEKFIETFGPKREDGEPVLQRHKDLAATLQARLENIVLRQLKRARNEFDHGRLCLAGGVALNCSMNGQIVASGLFDEIFVTPASGDDGTTVGACYLGTDQLTSGGIKPKKSFDFYKGYRADEEEIADAAKASSHTVSRPSDLDAKVAKHISDGKIVAWFQGGAEFGPRALGNRSILARPFPAEMKDFINARVKFREEFRPFAPAVMKEHQHQYFGLTQDSPHMMIACEAKGESSAKIPAVVHVDNTCRVQTVSPDYNARFYKLIEAFYELTGVPVILNTSFNVRGQPIVNTPKQAVATFESTMIDVLAIGDWLIEKQTN